MTFDVYTDGSCWNSCPFGVGAWAYAIVSPEDDDVLFFYEASTETKATSSTMEMQAVFEALKVLEIAVQHTPNSTIRIHSDSAYVVNCFLDRWYELWQDCQYIGVKNAELWKVLINKVKDIRKRGTKVQFVKVKGHSGDKYNELVDDLAGEKRKNLILILKGEDESKCRYKAEERAKQMLNARG